MLERIIVLLLAVILIGFAVWNLRTTQELADTSLPRAETNQPVNEMPLPESPAEPEPARPPIELVFVGDIMLDRDVWSKMERFGADYPFRKLEDLLAGADLVIGNLEGPVTERGSHAVPYGNLLFKFDPSVVDPLREAGIDAVSVANNHTLNQGREGLIETREHLQAGDIASFGDPKMVSVDNVWITSVGEWQLAFVGWNQIEIPDNGQGQLLDIVRTLEADLEIDAIIVLPHWGAEYRPQTDSQTNDAHALIDAGVDLIIGAHPHVVQGIEIYQDRFVAYSLGNFFFDQYWSTATQEGLVIRYRLSEAADEVILVPITLVAAQPMAAESATVAEILATIANLSHPDLGASINSTRLEVVFD